ncbi:MAG: hypothetical protein ACFFAN_10925 [Promethearchaeota archaeon]
MRNLQDLGYFSLFFGFSLMWLFYIVGDYYSSTDIVSPFLIWSYGSERALFLNFGYFTMIIAGFILLLSIEKYNVILFRKYVFTILFSICAILFLILFIIDIRITQLATYLYWTGVSAFFLVYLIKFMKKLHGKGIYLLAGLLFMFIGFLLTTDALINALGLEVRLIGAISQLISVVILSYFFLILPPFNEFDWQEKIEAVFLINKGGACLYYKYFKERKGLMDENIISAAIASINVMLGQLIERGKSGISILEKKGQTVVIYPSKYVNGVLYLSENLNYPKIVLKDFVERFETLYRNILINWNGDTNIFSPTEIIANEFFSQ